MQSSIMASSLHNDHYGQWFSIPGFSPEKLRGSDQGYVQIYDRRLNYWRHPTLGCLMSTGYRRVNVDYKSLSVHGLLCSVWHGPKPDPSMTPQHGPGGKGDNSRLNLLGWATKTQQRNEHQKKRVTVRNAKPIWVWKVGEPRSSGQAYASGFEAIQATGADNIRAVANGKRYKQAGGYCAEWIPPTEPQEDLEGEEWREVTPRLFVSNLGRYVRKDNHGDTWGYKITARPSTAEVYTTIVVERRHKQGFHVVVYDAFRNDRNGREVDHINHDVRDNRLVNLRAATRQENALNTKRSITRRQQDESHSPDPEV